MAKRLLRRWLCHGTLLCCQYIDAPTCNSSHDRHVLGLWRYRRHARRQAQEEQ